MGLLIKGAVSKDIMSPFRTERGFFSLTVFRLPARRTDFVACHVTSAHGTRLLTTIWLFVMRFCFSGALFVRGYREIDAESLQDGLQLGFERFYGVAPIVQLDNQKAGVSARADE
ncbi:MAG: hypothetical protein Q7J98_11410 [Kiritimatiellia bacterium]|nr:hypothetical protein [Kiritimatiellia bacterium]